MQAAGCYRTREVIVHRDGLYGNIVTLCQKYGADLEMVQKSSLKIQRYKEKTVQSLVREGILSQKEWQNLNKISYIPAEPSQITQDMSAYITEINRMLNDANAHNQNSLIYAYKTRSYSSFRHSEWPYSYYFDACISSKQQSTRYTFAQPEYKFRARSKR